MRVLPTPGHTGGHQSLLIDRPGGGPVLLAGQAYDFASQYGQAVLARRAAREGLAAPLPEYRAWLDRMAEHEPHRVLFAHDHAVWEATD